MIHRDTQLTAFGVTKSAADWCADPVCVVTFERLRDRVRFPAWTVERALTQPEVRQHPVPKPPKLKARGWKGKFSKYRGVTWKDGRWKVFITVRGQRELLGYFGDEIQAARAYNARAREVFGPDAKLNEV